jgi:Protein of unknown function (DUF2384)
MDVHPNDMQYLMKYVTPTNREVARLFDALADIIDKKVIGQWLQRPNQQFDGSTPLQVMERGETDRLWRMIWQLREGHSG